MTTPEISAPTPDGSFEVAASLERLAQIIKDCNDKLAELERQRRLIEDTRDRCDEAARVIIEATPLPPGTVLPPVFMRSQPPLPPA